MALEGRIAIVHGQKFGRDGKLRDGFIKRLDKAYELFAEKKCDAILVSGGKTREKYASESEIGGNYLMEFPGVCPIEENQSLTTVENVICVSKIIWQNTEMVYAISSKKRLPRLKFLYESLCPEIREKIQFVNSEEKTSVLEFCKEFLNLAYNRIDLRENFFAARLFRKIFRNEN